MNTFVNSVVKSQNVGRTFNNAVTNKSSLNPCVDLFGVIGTRNADFSGLFEQAIQQNLDVAVRIALWGRDVRGGAGERQTFRNLLKYMETNHPGILVQLLHKVPEVGRWDDLLIFETPAVKNHAFALIGAALAAGNGLAAKWMPRQGPVALELAEWLGMGSSVMVSEKNGKVKAGRVPSKTYRKLLVNLTKVVESAMCQNNWTDINYSHVPSLAAARYQKAFNKHDAERYSAYREELKKPAEERDPSVKINVGAVYPYDVIKSNKKGDKQIAQAQWDALPNFMGDKRIIPMVDTSGSMTGWNYYGQRGKGVKSNVTPLDVAVSLGIYCADKLKGAYNGLFLSFSAEPKLQRLTGTLDNKINKLIKSEWTMNTNFEAAFRLILKTAKENNVPQEDMPEVLLVLSDMEFDEATRSGYSSPYFRGRGPVREPNVTMFEQMRNEFNQAGYKLPQVVFWNLNGHEGNQPVTYNETGTALVSGFSPAIMKSILSVDIEQFTPENVMLETVMVDRYKWAA